jgi:radical SAM protein with 4Fe4S-binding SPASM domain
MRFEGFPYILGWELTLGCNLRCSHCGSSAGKPRDDELTLEESFAICDQFPSLLVQEVDFTGGEPILRSDWWRIASRLEELGICTKILTNGSALNSDIIDRMEQVGIDGVGVSLDGLEPTHDYIRGQSGHFRYVIKGIDLALKSSIPLTVITTVNALNLGELPSIFELLRSKGVKSWQIQPIFSFGRARKDSELQLAKEAYMTFGSFVNKWGLIGKDAGVDIAPGDNFGYFTHLDTRHPQWRGCSAGLVSCGITSNGKVKGCLSFPDELIEGDLRKNDLWDIWFHPNSFSFNRRFSAKDLGSECYPCDYAEVCRGGCSAMSYGYTGHFHNDPYCFHSISRQTAINTALAETNWQSHKS